MGAFNDGCAHVLNGVCSLVWVVYAVIHNTVHAHGDVVLGDCDLVFDVGELCAHRDRLQVLRAEVDLDQTWIDGFVESAETADETDRALVDFFEWVGAWAARDGTEETAAVLEMAGEGTGLTPLTRHRIRDR